MTISIINLKYFFLFLYFDLIIQNENLIGKKLFIENCNVCHLNKENKIIPEKTLKKNILETNGLNFPNNAPGLYLAPHTNNLIVMMNTYNVINEEVIVPDVPLNKWFNVIIRCRNTTLDVYANGTIVRSINLIGVPKQNYGDVFVGLNGGFDGNVSNLWYYDYALGTAEIQRIVNGGPNTTMIGSNGMSDKLTNYLSLRWYFSGNGDSYNPTSM